MKQKRMKTLIELGCILLFYVLVSALLTWPMILHMDEVIVGGGEFGGWFWRQWWHFSEVRALDKVDLGWIGTLESIVALGRFPAPKLMNLHTPPCPPRRRLLARVWVSLCTPPVVLDTSQEPRQDI